MRRRYGRRLGGASRVFPGPSSPRVHTNLYRVIAGATPLALHRLAVVKWLGAHQGFVRRTARHFGHSPDSVARWAERYYAKGVEGLIDKSRRPKKVRTPTTPLSTALGSCRSTRRSCTAVDRSPSRRSTISPESAWS